MGIFLTCEMRKGVKKLSKTIPNILAPPFPKVDKGG